MFYLHLVADAPYQYRALIYCAKTGLEMFGIPNPDYGLSLYTNKVLIQQQCKDLIPKYFRFIKGVVDSEDVPLNISRETIKYFARKFRTKKIYTK